MKFVLINDGEERTLQDFDRRAGPEMLGIDAVDSAEEVPGHIMSKRDFGQAVATADDIGAAVGVLGEALRGRRRRSG